MAEPYPIPTSISDCYETMAQLDEDIASIEDQLLEAKQLHKTTGEYADPEWFRAANFALKMKQAERLRMNGVMIRLKREENMMDGFFEAIGRVVVDEWELSDLNDVAEALEDREPEFADVLRGIVAREAA